MTAILSREDELINRYSWIHPANVMIMEHSIQAKVYFAWTAPSHHLNQCWNIVNCILWNTLQWNLNRNSNIFIQENAFENAVCEMAPILSRPQCDIWRHWEFSCWQPPCRWCKQSWHHCNTKSTSLSEVSPQRVWIPERDTRVTLHRVISHKLANISNYPSPLQYLATKR